MKHVEPMGAHWNDTEYSKLYQLHRRVEHLATELAQRRFRGLAPLREHIVELQDIAVELKTLEKKIAA